jgi:hypothetical protein
MPKKVHTYSKIHICAFLKGYDTGWIHTFQGTNMRTRILLALIACLMAITLQPAQPTHAAQRCFSETNQCIDGRIREFWEQNGGLAVFGLPIRPLETIMVAGQSVQSQLFERNRLELHPENSRPYDVQLGRLGAQYTSREFSQENLPSEGIEETDIGGSYLAYRNDCRWFVETQHYICGDFYYYWHNHGLNFDKNPKFNDAERIALFGLPISSFRKQTINGKQFFVQIFERARFEYHPENPEPYKVLLGLLGNEEGTAPEITPTPVIETPTIPTTSPINILPESDLAAFRYRMPSPGYWTTTSDGLVISVGSFQYLQTLKGKSAPKGQKYVVFAVSVKNTRELSYRGEFVPALDFSVIDLEGASHALDYETYGLDDSLSCGYLSPGEVCGGQLAFLIPSNSAPAQVVYDMITYEIVIELRTWPIS